MFNKGDLVVRLIEGFGTPTATIQQVALVDDRGVQVVDPMSDEDHPRDINFYSLADGREIKPPIPRFSSRIVPLDGGEEERLAAGITRRSL